MTFFKTALLSAAAVAIAAPAFADGHMEKKNADAVTVKTTATLSADELADMKAKQMDAMRQKQIDAMKADVMTTGGVVTDTKAMTTVTTDTMTASTDLDMDASKVNDTVGEILQADGEPSIQSDDDIIVEDYTIEDDKFRAADDDGMIKDNAIVVPGSAGTITTVTCPAGTTAQPDMTCMITGDYKTDLDD